MHPRSRRRVTRRPVGPDARAPYVTLSTRAAAAGWSVRIGIARVVPVRAPGHAEDGRLGLSFRATLLRADVPVAESRGLDVLVDSLPSVVWRDVGACGAFVRACREWWPDGTASDVAVVGQVLRELVWERALEIGELAPARTRIP